MSWVRDSITALIKFIAGEGRDFVHQYRQKKKLRQMLQDDRFLKGFRSTYQLVNGIAADRETTERLLLDIGARKSEVSDEWTLNPPRRPKT